MSSDKETAMTLFLIGSILWVVSSAMQVLAFLVIIDYYFTGLVGAGLQIAAAVLIMVGILKYRSTMVEPAIQSGQPFVAQGGAAPVQAAESRFCPNCGRQIAADAKFCPYCGWQAEQKKKPA